MDAEYSSLLEKLDRVTACVTRLEARINILEERINHVYNTEERCITIMDTSLDYLFKHASDEMKNDVLKVVCYVVDRHNHEVIISDEELARITVQTYFDKKVDYERRERKKVKKEQASTSVLIEEISSISLEEEEEISSPVTILGEEELASPITEEDVTEIQAVTSLSS